MASARSTNGAKRRRRLLPSKLEMLAALALAPVGFYWCLTKLADADGVAKVHDDQVAVVVDHLTGKQRVSTAPGHQIFLPWFQEVFVLDKKPLEFRFEGHESAKTNQFPQLVVRADDGSNFWFDTFTLQYALMPDRAATVLADSGPGEGYKKYWVNAVARSVLRDEFGRFSTEDIVKPENLRTVTSEAQKRMNEILRPHGLSVLEVALAKPRFDPAYEKAIERRKVGNQEVDHLKAQIEKLTQERVQRIAKANKEKEAELLVKNGNLARDQLSAEREAITIRSAADIYALQKLSEAKSTRNKKEQEAGARVASYTQQAEGLAAKAQAVASQGEEAVRAALIDRLASIEFNIIPYSRDASPKRVESGDGAKP